MYHLLCNQSYFVAELKKKKKKNFSNGQIWQRKWALFTSLSKTPKRGHASLRCTIKLPTEWSHYAEVLQLTVKARNSNANLTRHTSKSWRYAYLVGCLNWNRYKCVWVCLCLLVFGKGRRGGGGFQWSTSRPGRFATGGRAAGAYWKGPRAVADAVNNIKLTHCGRVTQIWVFNTVKLGTSASSP